MNLLSQIARISILVITIIIFISCGETSLEWHTIEGHKWANLEVEYGNSGLTLMESDQTAIKFKNQISDDLIASNRALLNGSGVATPRLMVALLETYQQDDGTIKLPAALHPFMNTEIIAIP